jgi:hypothetical protein
VDTRELLRHFSEEDAALVERLRPRFNPEQYRARPGSYKRGGKVKKSGLALLHKGERVLTRRAAKVLAKRSRKKRKQTR